MPRSFAQDIGDLEGVREALTAFVARAGEKLRREELAAGHLGVFLHTNPFAAGRAYYSNAAGVNLTSSSDYTPELLELAMRRFGRD